MQVTYWQGPTKEHHHYSKNGFGRKQRNKKKQGVFYYDFNLW